MTYIIKSIGRLMAVMLMSCVAFLGVLVVSDWVYAVGNSSSGIDISEYNLLAYDENNAEINGKVYVDEGETLNLHFDVMNGDEILGQDKYDIVKETFDVNGNVINTILISGNAVALSTGESGIAAYKFTATAKSGSDYTGSCNTYIELGSRMSLNGYNADVSVDDTIPLGIGMDPMRDYYILTKEGVDGFNGPMVSIDGTELQKDYYTILYIPENREGDESPDLPSDPGVYVCRIVGEGIKGNGYYGTCNYVAIRVVGSQEEVDAIVKAAGFAENLEEIFGTDFITFTSEVNNLRERYNDMEPIVKQAIPQYVMERFISAENIVKFHLIVNSINANNPDPGRVAEARETYNRIVGDCKVYVEDRFLKWLEKAEIKLAEDKVAAEARARAEAAAKARAAAEAKAKKVKTVKINVKTVNATVVNSAVSKAGGSNKYVTKFVLGKKVKKIKKGAFKKYKKVKTLEVRTKALKKATIKNSLKGSNVKSIKVKVGKKKANKAQIKKYRKIFTKKIVGKKVSVK